MNIYIKDTNRKTGKVTWKKVSLDDTRGDLELMIDWGGCVGDKIVIKDETIHGMPIRELGDVKTVEAEHSYTETKELPSPDGKKVRIFVDKEMIYEEAK